MDTPPFFYISWQAGVVSLGDCCMNIEWILHASFRVSLFLIHWELGIGRDDISRLTVFDFLRTCRIVSRETCHFPSVPVTHDSSNLLSLLLGCLDYEQHRGFEGVSSGFWLPALSILLCFYWAFAHLLPQKNKICLCSLPILKSSSLEHLMWVLDLHHASDQKAALSSLCTVVPSNSPIYLVPVLAWHTKPLPNSSPCRFPINKTYSIISHVFF